MQLTGAAYQRPRRLEQRVHAARVTDQIGDQAGLLGWERHAVPNRSRTPVRVCRHPLARRAHGQCPPNPSDWNFDSVSFCRYGQGGIRPKDGNSLRMTRRFGNTLLILVVFAMAFNLPAARASAKTFTMSRALAAIDASFCALDPTTASEAETCAEPAPAGGAAHCPFMVDCSMMNSSSQCAVTGVAVSGPMAWLYSAPSDTIRPAMTARTDRWRAVRLFRPPIV